MGQPWVASIVGLRPPEPWWAEHAREPVPEEVRSLGVIDLQGSPDSVTLNSQSTIVSVGSGLRVVVPGSAAGDPVPVHGRLWLDAHEYPEYAGAQDLQWRGTVRRILGIRLIYEPVTVYLAIPVRQEPPVELGSTAGDSSPGTADRDFSEYLIELETH